MQLKYRKNLTFLEARKIVESYMKDNTSSNVAQKAIPIGSSTANNINQFDKNRTLIGNLL